MMISKEDALKMFRENKSLIKVLSLVKDEKEKRVISGVAETFLTNFCDLVNQVKDFSEKDPNAFNKMVEDVTNRVVTVDSNKQTENNNVEK